MSHRTLLGCLLVIAACVGLASVAVLGEESSSSSSSVAQVVNPVQMVKSVFAATCPKACGATCTIMFHRCNVACNRRCQGADWKCSNQCSSQCGVTNNDCVRSCQAGLQVAAATLSQLVEEEKTAGQEETHQKTPLGALERSVAASNFAAVHAAVTSQVESPSVEPCQDPTWKSQCQSRLPGCKNACRCGGGGVDAAMRCNKCQVACDEDYDACIYCGMGVQFCCSGGVMCDDGWNTVAAKLA